MNLLKQVFKLNKLDYVKILKKSLILVVAVTIVYYFLSESNYQNKISEYQDITRITDQTNANYISFSVNHYLADLKDDLFILKNSDEMTAYVNHQNTTNLEEVESLFLRFSHNKSDLSQIRFINTSGMEVIRVNHLDDPVLVSSMDLQDKSERYYFLETMQLEDNQVYISKLDLNIENDHIELPYQPVIRMSTPLYQQDQLIGILIVNLNAHHLLNAIFASDHTEYSETLSLFNNEGYYIYNDNEDILYGHVIDDRQQYQLTQAYPMINLLDNTESQSITVDQHFITYIEIDPFKDLNAISSNGQWLIVHETNLINVIPSNHLLLTLDIYDFMSLIGIWLLIFLAVAINYIYRREGFKLNVVRRIADETSDAVVISNENQIIEYANKSFFDFTGYEQDAIINQHTRLLKSQIHGKLFYQKLWEHVDQNGYWQGILWQKKKNQLIFPKHMIIYEMRDHKSRHLTNYVSLSKDLAANGAFIQPNISLNDLDSFKQYLNQDLIESFLNQPDFEEDKLFGSIAISLNQNDEYRQFAEQSNQSIQQSFVEFMQSCLETHFGFIVRISPQTYIVAFKNFNHEKEVESFIETCFSQPLIQISNKYASFLLSFHAGIAITSKFHHDYMQMIDHAHTTLQYNLTYQKQNIAYYSEKMENTIAREKEITYHLKRAIDKNEFYLVYQPQINSDTNEIIGYEILLRWKNEVLGLISPYEFIRIAEERGMIIDIGYWVIEETFKHYHEMNLQGKILSINISPIQFLDQKLASEVSYLAAKYDVNLTNIEFEVTESVLVTDFNLAQNRLKTFKKLGISIAIDDFGTGYSSLQYISKFDVNKLKLDRSFVKDYQPGDELFIAKHVINLSKDLNIKVICEGTETIEQINYLKSIGVHIFQGYYYAKPMIFSEIKTYEQSFK